MSEKAKYFVKRTASCDDDLLKLLKGFSDEATMRNSCVNMLVEIIIVGLNRVS